MLYLYFDEPVDTSNLDQTKIQMQNSPLPFTSAYNLSNTAGATVYYDSDSYKMTVQFALQTDYTDIVSDSDIFSQQEKTFLSMLPSFAMDTAGNKINLINEADAVGMAPRLLAGISTSTALCWSFPLARRFIKLHRGRNAIPEELSRANDDPYVTRVHNPM